MARPDVAWDGEINDEEPEAPVVNGRCRGCYDGIDPQTGDRVQACYRYWWRSETCVCSRSVAKRSDVTAVAFRKAR